MRSTPALLAATLALLTLALLAPIAGAAPTCHVTKVGWAACVNPTGECVFTWLVPPFTDFYPGAGTCQSVDTANGVALCAFEYAGFASLGGWNGAWADACARPKSGVEGCAFAGNSWSARPVCV